jgi:hypothetical protein
MSTRLVAILIFFVFLSLPENVRISDHVIMAVDTIEGVPRGQVNILGGHSSSHSKQKCVYIHVSYSERFPR